jgi:serine protease Do
MRNRKLWSALSIGVTTVAVAIGVAAAYPNLSRDTSPSHGQALAGPRAPAAISPQEAQRAAAAAKDLSTAFRAAAEKVLPSVVAIELSPETTPVAEHRQPRGPLPRDGENPFEGTPFEDFFRNIPRGQEFGFRGIPVPQPRGNGMGSGVIIDAAGVILTNNHVVSGGKVTVRLYDGREFPAASVATDPQTDIAVVKIEGADNLVAATLGDSDAVAVGDWVLALGQPFGLESTVTAGIVSALHRGVGITPRESFLQTDAAINPGNSGGPLVNLEGEVVGINTAISSRSGGNDGVGFAIPIGLAKWVSGQLSNGGMVQRAYLGVGIQPMTASLAQQFHVQPREGVVVTEVMPDTPAAHSGLRAGDVILSYAGERVSSPQELQLAVERSEIGKNCTVTVLRDGKNLDLQFTPAKQPADFGQTTPSATEAPRSGNAEFKSLGLEVDELNPAVAEQLGLKETQGVVVTGVQADSPAERAGLESGMLIVEADRQPIKTVADLKKAVNENQAGDNLLLLVRTAQGSRYVVVHP